MSKKHTKQPTPQQARRNMTLMVFVMFGATCLLIGSGNWSGALMLALGFVIGITCMYNANLAQNVDAETLINNLKRIKKDVDERVN